jgi:hypothetical protein
MENKSSNLHELDNDMDCLRHGPLRLEFAIVYEYYGRMNKKEP